ncbi:right-handed parallel beta-helix repeat-containing protein [Candidatus Pacearchaeota archaeon]|nr:right-handed parallel beta-helix repeat-containing protein [Candidatus Pacearchaeota archaeon]
MKLFKYLFLLLTLSLSGATTTITVTVCPSTDVQAHGNPISMVKFKHGCTVDIGTGNVSPDPVVLSESSEEGSTATLDGSGSSDSDGSIVTYLWEQKEGDTVSITNADQAVATFTTPTPQVMKFFLYLTDNDGAQSLGVSTITATEPAANEAPVANAGEDYSINENLTATLNGSGSTDPNNNIDTYLWTQTVGTAVNIILDDQEIASFTPPDVASSTPLTFNLLVTDTGTLFDNDTVIVTILPVSAGTVYFVSACDSGADVDCVVGNDSNDGLSHGNAWATYDKAQDEFGNLDAGDEILFAKGGVFDISGSVAWVNDNATAENPVVIGDYTPTWGSGDEGKPIIVQAGSSGNVFGLDNAGLATSQEGYKFQNIELQCTDGSATGWGIFLYNDIDDVTIDNLDISGCAIGVHAGGSQTCESDPTCDGLNERLTIRNSTINDNTGQGYLGGSNNYIIENNTFSDNGSGSSQSHNLYLSNESDGTRISGNTLTHSSLNGSDICQGISLVVHGVHSDLLIENNQITEDSAKAANGCYGLQVGPAYGSTESFTNVTIRGNTITDVGRIAIHVGACQNCIVENNIINEINQSVGFTGINVPMAGSGGDATVDQMTIRNNTIHIGSTPANGTGIKLNDEGANHTVTGNVIQYDGSNSFDCFGYNLAFSAYDLIDNNQCWYPSASPGEWEDGTGDLSTWQTASGHDLNSLNTDPGL